MKSKNPHSGCREVDIARTLDTTCPDPSKNQGGIAIVQNILPIASFDPTQITSKPNASRVSLLSTTKKLGIIAIENHPADSRVKMDEIGTIQTSTGGGNVPLILNDQGGSSVTIEKNNISPTLRREAHGNQPIVAFSCNQRDEVRDTGDCAVALQAQSGMKQQTFCLQGNMISRDNENSPQGDGINENVSFTLNATDRHAVSYTSSSFAQYQEGVGTLKASGGDLGEGSESLITFAMQRSDEYKSSDVSHTLATRDYKDSTDLILSNKKTVRRLTPKECARLQGFPETWCSDIPHSDTAEYKMWGNGMALPCVLYIMQNIVALYEN